MSIFYDILFAFIGVLYFPFLILRGKWHSGFKLRFGCFPAPMFKQFEGKQCLWIHAVSIGEVLAVADLIKKLKDTLPQYTLVCSTVTKTGNQIAKEKLGDTCLIIYAPLDFSWVVRKFIALIKPKMYISAETEIWPNLYTLLHKNGVPIVQINGRISDNAFKGYKCVGFLTKRVLNCVSLFYMQSSLDAERIKRLGALPERVHVVGNLKFDSIPENITIRKEDLGFERNEDIWIAGSTHPGEEDIILDVFNKLENEFPNLRLVLAPRHIERAQDVSDLIGKKGYPAERFSQIREGNRMNKAVVVVDTIGHLRKLYGLAKIVFIGKTLTVGGGQNMVEPAFFGKPIIVGPLTQNFQSIVRVFLDAKALVQVNNAEELLVETRNLLANPDRAERIGAAAKQTVLRYQGATEKTVEAITRFLN